MAARNAPADESTPTMRGTSFWRFLNPIHAPEKKHSTAALIRVNPVHALVAHGGAAIDKIKAIPPTPMIPLISFNAKHNRSQLPSLPMLGRSATAR